MVETPTHATTAHTLACSRERSRRAAEVGGPNHEPVSLAARRTHCPFWCGAASADEVTASHPSVRRCHQNRSAVLCHLGGSAGRSNRHPSAESPRTALMSWSSRGSEDVGGRDIDRIRSEAEALAVLDDETGCLDRGERVASGVTSAGEERADRAIRDALHAGRSGTFRDDVFEEAQFTTWADHAAEFGERVG